MKETKATSIDKAFEVCEALSRVPRGLSLGELARLLQLPPPTLHRTLSVLRRRGYVRQDEETQRYGLTLKMLDLSFQQLGRSELRLHAYPVLREYVLRAGTRSFLSVPSHDEVTYVWAAGGVDEVAMRTVYGREMPARCTCAPVYDYTGREVARVGVFAHRAEDRVLTGEYQQACRELARQISVRLGHLPAVSLGLPA
jgi:DNA-binding IclR family transcriptional regulator